MAQELELFLELNAILMNGLDADADQLENEKGVVLQEFRQRWENNPTARASHQLRAALRGAPAYDHPIIGFEEEFTALTSQDLLDFQDIFAFFNQRQKTKSLFEGVHLVMAA